MSKITELLNRIRGLFNNNKRLPSGRESIKLEDFMPENKSTQQSTFRTELKEHAEMSLLDPNRYQTKEDFYIALLEDMGVDKTFKQNPRAKNDLINLTMQLVKKDGNLSGLDIKSIDDAKKIQDSLKNMGMRISGNTVSILQKSETPKETTPYLEGQYTQLKILNDLTYEKGTTSSFVSIASTEASIVTKKSTYSKSGIETQQVQACHNKNNNTLQSGTLNASIDTLNKSFYTAYANPIDMSIEQSHTALKAGKQNAHITTIKRLDAIGQYLSVQYEDRNGNRNMKTTNRTEFSDDLANIILDPVEQNALVNNDEATIKNIQDSTIEMQNKNIETETLLNQINKSKYKSGLMDIAERSGLIESEIQLDD